MTIEINKSTKRIEKPTVRARGRLISSNGFVNGVNTTTLTNDIQADSTVSTNWRNQETTVFSGNVTITLVPDSKYLANLYTNRTASDFVGKNIRDPRSVGGSSDTYYTLNGKIPQRTKTNLYYRPFVLTRNESGSDNIVLKARTYYNGQWSEVTTVEFRIVRNDEKYV